MTLTSVIGLLGNILFIYSALPEVVRTIKAGKALGSPLDLILTICLGMLAMGLYTYLSRGFDLILVLNYGLQFILWSILLYFRIFKYRIET